MCLSLQFGSSSIVFSYSLVLDMSWWQILVVLSSLVCWGHAQAPGDGDSYCLTGPLAFIHPTYPKTFKPLMDSRDYDQILGEASAVWQQVDVDGNDGGGGVQTSVSPETIGRRVTLV